MKSFVALLLASLFSVLRDTQDIFNWAGLQCYNCIYIEDLCGIDCKNGYNLVTGLTGTNREMMAGTICNFNRYKNAKSPLNGTVTSRSGSSAEHPRRHHPYCLQATLDRDGKEMIYRSYGWFADPNLHGKTKKDIHFVIDGTPYVADLHLCNEQKCNGHTSSEFGWHILKDLVVSILVKFSQSLTYFGYSQ